MIKEQLRVRIALSFGGIFLAGVVGFSHLAPRSGVTDSDASVAFAKPAPRPALKPAGQTDSAEPDLQIPERLRAKQQKDLRKYRFDKLKENASELAKLANSLHEELDKSNENILSLEIVDKAAKIEKLAKKIQDEAKTGT
jgi:hypothetical protein